MNISNVKNNLKTNQVIAFFIFIAIICFGFFIINKLNTIEHKIINLSYNNKFILEQFGEMKNLKYNPFVRKIQEGHILNLKKFETFCKENNLTFWLDSGTLIASMRHEKFIPWDDDIDVGMMRGDYEKLKKIGIEKNLCALTKYRISCQGIDIFPYDYLDEKNINIINFRRYFRTSLVFSFFSLKWRRKFIENTWKKYQISFSNKIIPGSEYYKYGYSSRIFETQDIFPLQKGKFENYIFQIPNNSNKYLTLMYGKWMYLPNHFGKYNI